jgi:hypothetical protein
MVDLRQKGKIGKNKLNQKYNEQSFVPNVFYAKDCAFRKNGKLSGLIYYFKVFDKNEKVFLERTIQDVMKRDYANRNYQIVYTKDNNALIFVSVLDGYINEQVQKISTSFIREIFYNDKKMYSELRKLADDYALAKEIEMDMLLNLRSLNDDSEKANKICDSLNIQRELIEKQKEVFKNLIDKYRIQTQLHKVSGSGEEEFNEFYKQTLNSLNSNLPDITKVEKLCKELRSITDYMQNITGNIYTKLDKYNTLIGGKRLLNDEIYDAISNAGFESEETAKKNILSQEELVRSIFNDLEDVKIQNLTVKSKDEKENSEVEKSTRENIELFVRDAKSDRAECVQLLKELKESLDKYKNQVSIKNSERV